MSLCQTAPSRVSWQKFRLFTVSRHHFFWQNQKQVFQWDVYACDLMTSYLLLLVKTESRSFQIQYMVFKIMMRKLAVILPGVFSVLFIWWAAVRCGLWKHYDSYDPLQMHKNPPTVTAYEETCHVTPGLRVQGLNVRQSRNRNSREMLPIDIYFFLYIYTAVNYCTIHLF